MISGFHPVLPWADLEEHSRTSLRRLRTLRRRRAVLAIVCAVVTAVAAVLIGVAPLLPITVIVLIALITAAVINLCIATTSVLRLTKEIRARRYEARFPDAAE